MHHVAKSLLAVNHECAVEIFALPLGNVAEPPRRAEATIRSHFESAPSIVVIATTEKSRGNPEARLRIVRIDVGGSPVRRFGAVEITTCNPYCAERFPQGGVLWLGRSERFQRCASFRQTALE